MKEKETIMALQLTKGSKIALEKENHSGTKLTKIYVGLGWDIKPEAVSGANYDLDASVFLLEADGKAHGKQNVVYYRNQVGVNKSVILSDDNRTGAGDGDDEHIIVDLTKLPESIQKVMFTVTIYEADKNGQNFGQVRNAYIRIVNAANDQELLRYDLSEDFSTDTGIIVGSIYRHNNEFKFEAAGQGYKQGLGAIADAYLVD